MSTNIRHKAGAGKRSAVDEAYEAAENAEYDKLHAAVDPLSAAEPYRITDTTEIELPTPIVTLFDSVISTPGNATMISGPPKSGKTAFVCAIEAGAISTTGVVDGFDGLSVAPNQHKYAVVHIDTEQARHRQQYNLLTVLNRAGFEECPDYYHSYNIRTLSLDRYIEFTEGVCRALKLKFGGVHIVVIDGLADYVADVNDGGASIVLFKWVEQLAVELNCPIIIVMHTNPNTDKERGHVGSQAQRKCESVLQVKSEEDISYVEAKYLRLAGKADIPQLQFTYDQEKGYHVSAGVRVDEKTSKHILTESEAFSLADKVFGQGSLQYNEAWQGVKRVTRKGDNASKRLLKTLQEMKVVSKGADGKYCQTAFNSAAGTIANPF